MMVSVTGQSEPGQLRTFGRLQFDGCPSLGPQQLLLLCYVALEGSQPRAELALLFWPHLASELTKKGERKHLSNLGVALAVLRREAGIDLEHPGVLGCDAGVFEQHLSNEQFDAALALYRCGRFLDGIEYKPRLRLGQELWQWIASRRETYDRAARVALVEMAERDLASGSLETARALSEEACRIEAAGDPTTLLRLRRLLTDLRSPFASSLDGAMGASLEALELSLSPDALRLYLVLSLQQHPNLAAAQRAVELSARAAADALEELREARVALADWSLLLEPARRHLDEHPAEKMALLSALRSHTPPEQAFGIYRAIFELSHSFGGVGYWERARAAYGHQASALIAAQDFQGAVDALAQLQRAEYLNQQTPDPQTRFLHAYGLERLRHFNQGLEVLDGVPETPEVLAIKSALLMHTGDYSSARQAAERVIKNAASSAWARAIALNSAGQIAYDGDRLLEAEVFFDQAGVTWSLAGHPQREAGAFVNRANVLERLGRVDDARRAYEDALSRAGRNDALRTRTLLNLGYMYERLEGWEKALGFYEQARALCETGDLARKDGALAASVFNNLGYVQWKLGLRDPARVSIERAMRLAQTAGDRRLYGVALGNMALIERTVGKLEMALELFRQLGNDRDYEEHAALYVQMLEELLAESEGQPQSVRFYLDKLMDHFDRHERADLAADARTRFEPFLDAPEADDSGASR